MCFCHFHNRLLQYHLLGSTSFKGFNGDPLVNATFIYCWLFFSPSTRLSSISFDLKKATKVRELVEQFKEIGTVPMRIIHVCVSLSELQIDSTSYVAFPLNLVLFGLGIASSFRFFDSLVSSFGASLCASLSCLFSIALCLCILLF